MKALVLNVGQNYPDLEVKMPDGSEPTGDTHHDVMEALYRAWTFTGAQAYSEDVRLDLEDCRDAMAGHERALGIVVHDLMARGYTLTLVPVTYDLSYDEPERDA